MEAERVRLGTGHELHLGLAVLRKLLLQVFTGDGSRVVAAALNAKDAPRDERNATESYTFLTLF